MLLSLGSTLLILLITASLVVRRGLYRTTILFFCCLMGAVVAFGFYENVLIALMGVWNVEFIQWFGEALAFIVLFVAVTLALDLAAEQLLVGNMTLPPLVDRIGAGFVGFWTAQLAVGVLCIAIQMLPWDRSVLGFERIYESRKEEKTRHLLLRPDAFTAGLVGYLTDNALGGGQGFRSVHPDLLEELARSNMRVQAESRRVAPPDISGAEAFSVSAVWQVKDPELKHAYLEASEKSGGAGEMDYVMKYHPTAVDSTEGHRYLVARCRLKADAAQDRWHRFTPQQVRMVGTLNGRPRQYYLKGYRDPAKMKDLGLLRSEQPVLIESQRRDCTFDLIFEVPEAFVPSFVEYKRLARSDVTRQKIEPEETKTILASLKYAPPEKDTKGKAAGLRGLIPDRVRQKIGIRGPDGARARTPPKDRTKRPPPKTKRPAKKPPPRKDPGAEQATPRGPGIMGLRKKTSAAPPNQAPKGRVRGRLVKRTGFGNELPFALDRDALTGQQTELSGTALRSGHVYVPVAKARGDPGQLVSSFVVPRQSRLLQLECDAVHAKSFLGKAKAFAVKAVGQYAVVDSNGRKYLPVGEYRIATVGGKQMMELQYDAEGMPGRSVGRDWRITENRLQAGSTVTFLYHIPPGTRLVEFSAGPQALSKATLSITAPR